MDTLYRTIRDHPQSFSFALALHIVFAVTYVLVHSAVLYVQLVSLNVAVNSRSSALLTLLISNNFVELKVRALLGVSCALSVQCRKLFVGTKCRPACSNDSRQKTCSRLLVQVLRFLVPCL